jgi:TolB-like protein/Tfp pilus assembly protein PilF
MADAELPPGLVREHLGRILDSASLRSAESLRRLLRYTVETTLAGKGEELKEYTIGVEALGRPGSFDPRQDNIVRVQARKLRERLATYYGGEGRKESCRIVYHPGSYLPVFDTAQEPALPPRTVAVLPLMNLTADSGVGYFCDGLAEELIDLLARSDGLRVVARTSSFQFKGAQMDAREIGQRLGADLLIEGAVRSAGDRYRITVRLLSSNDGCEIWAERYDRTLYDVLELEAQIAANVASALSSGTPPPGSTTDSEAITLYLRARYAWNQRTEAGFRNALGLYTAATRRDSRAAKAWAGIAECHVLMNLHGLALPHICMPQAREAALTALAIDPDLAPARSALAAVICLYDRDYEAAAEEWRRALALDPEYATAHHWFAALGLPALQRTEAALKQIREAERLDPLSAPIANDVGFVLYWSRRFDEAIEQCQKTLAMHPGFCRAEMLLGRVLAAQGRYAESVESCLKARDASEGASYLPYLLGTLGFAYASGGNGAAAREVMGELLRLEQACAVTVHEQAVVSVALGNWDEALRALEMAFEQRTGWAIFVPIEPLLDPLRARGLLSERSLT